MFLGKLNIRRTTTGRHKRLAFRQLFFQLRRQFLKEHRRITYTNLLTSGKLSSHLAEIQQSAQRRMEEIVAQMAKAQGVTEELKASDQMKWVGLMNNIQNAAEETVLAELIYS